MAPPIAAAAAPVAVQLAQHVERVADVVRLSAAHGVARARLALHPDDLGTVEVRLRSTAQGLVATIGVDHPEALQAIARAGADLQQQLTDRGLTVLRLDVTLTGGAATHDTAGQAGAREDRQTAPTRTFSLADTVADEDADLPTSSPSHAPALGERVDVRA